MLVAPSVDNVLGWISTRVVHGVNWASTSVLEEWRFGDAGGDAAGDGRVEAHPALATLHQHSGRCVCVVDEVKLIHVMLKRPKEGLSPLNIEGAKFKHSRSEESGRASLLTCAGSLRDAERFLSRKQPWACGVYPEVGVRRCAK